MKAISLQRTRYFHIGSICWFKSLLLGGETVHNENKYGKEPKIYATKYMRHTWHNFIRSRFIVGLHPTKFDKSKILSYSLQIFIWIFHLPRNLLIKWEYDFVTGNPLP